MDFNDDLVNCLKALSNGQLIGIPTRAGWMLCGNATDDMAMQNLIGIWRHRPGHIVETHWPVVLLADERDLLQYVSALDLAVFEWLDTQADNVAIWFEGVIGLSDCLLTVEGSAPITLVRDDFSNHLIKRFRRPLAVISVERNKLTELVQMVTGEHTIPYTSGFELKKFG